MELSSSQDGEIQIPTNNYVATGVSVSTNGHAHHHLIHHHHVHDHHPPPPPPPPLLHHHNNIITSSSAAAVPVSAAVVPQSQNPTTTNSTGVELDLEQSSYKKPLSQVVVKYRECLKNHAAAMGGNATDGCGEFMPSGEQGSIEALTCSACHCHRNFHRKEIEGETDEENYQHHHNSPFSFNFNRQQQQHHSMRKFMLPLPDQPLGLGYHHHHTTPNSTSAAATGNNNNILPSRAVAPPPHGHIIMPFNYNLPSESDEQEEHGRAQSQHQQVVMKKRFRTKFTQEQKEKMLNFAEKVGWKFQKQEESLVQQFCAEIGVKRRVLKVWMHNNKHNLAKKQHIDITTDNLPTP